MAAASANTLCRRLMGLSVHGGGTNITKTSLRSAAATTSTTSVATSSCAQRVFTPQIPRISWKRAMLYRMETWPCHTTLARPLSSTTTTTSQPPAAAAEPPDVQDEVDDIVTADDEKPTMTKPTIVQTEDGRQFAAFDMRRHPKLKPYIVKRRLNRMRIYVGAEKNIRVSPWRLNLVCQLAAGLPLIEALKQLEFCTKKTAPLVQKVLKRTSNLADIRHGLQPSQLEVSECFATKGTPLKRIKIMGRGRSGKKERKHAHFRVVLREIDFKLRIYQAPTINQKKKWFLLQQQAEGDYARAKVERDEIERLKRETAAAAEKKKTAG